MEKMRLSQRCKNSAQKQSRKRTGAQKPGSKEVEAWHAKHLKKKKSDLQGMFKGLALSQHAPAGYAGMPT